MEITANCTIDLRYKKNGKKNSGKYNIKLCVYINGERKYYKTHFNLTKDEWDKLNTKNLKDSTLLKYRKDIKAIEAAATEILDKLDNPTHESFEESYFDYTQKKDESHLMSFWFDKYSAHLEAAGRPYSYVKHIITSKNSFELFKPKLHLKQVTFTFLRDYTKWMESQLKSDATIKSYMRDMRTTLYFAKEKKAITKDQIPFGDGGYTVGTITARKNALTKSQINKIKVLKLTLKSDLDHSRDIFLFQYYCNGMNILDVCKLKYKDIDQSGEFFTFIRTKTRKTTTSGKPIRVHIVPKAQEIIKKWGTNNIDGYVFPFFEAYENEQTKSKLERNRSLFIAKKLNKSLKIISTKLEFPFTITTGTARHSYATVLSRAGVSVMDIGEGMGHSSIKTTQGYIASMDDQRIKTISNKL